MLAHHPAITLLKAAPPQHQGQTLGSGLNTMRLHFEWTVNDLFRVGHLEIVITFFVDTRHCLTTY